MLYYQKAIKRLMCWESRCLVGGVVLHSSSFQVRGSSEFVVVGILHSSSFKSVFSLVFIQFIYQVVADGGVRGDCYPSFKLISSGPSFIHPSSHQVSASLMGFRDVGILHSSSYQVGASLAGSIGVVSYCTVRTAN